MTFFISSNSLYFTFSISQQSYQNKWYVIDGQNVHKTQE